MIRARRVVGRWPFRRQYEVEALDESGRVVRGKRTGSLNSYMVRNEGVHTTDSWDWSRSVEEAFAHGDGRWVTDPYRTQ